MKKSEIIQIINDSIENKNLCRVGYKYNDFLKFLFPLLANEKLFLSSKEEDFEFGGYHIGKISNVDTIDIRTDGDRLFEIIKAEGLSKYFDIPDVNLFDWKSVFESLQKRNGYIIVKCEKDYDTEYAFTIGKIIKINTKGIIMKDFNCDGEWYEDVFNIPFSKITCVEFNSRYCNIFSKHI